MPDQSWTVRRRMRGPFAVLIAAAVACVLLLPVQPAHGCVYSGKLRAFNRAVAKYLANPTPARLARICALQASIEAKFKNAPGFPTPALPPGVVCPPPAPRGRGRGGGAGGGGGGGGGAGGGMAGGNAQPGGAPANPFGFVRNFNAFDCDYSWVVTADINNPAGFTVMNPTGTITVPAMSTAFVTIDIEIVALTLSGTTADFDISWTEDCTGLPVIDDMDHFRVTALDDFTFAPLSPGVVLPPGVPTTITWTVTNHTPAPLMKSYAFTSTVDYYSVADLNSGLPYGIGNVFPIDKSDTGGVIIIPPLSTVSITAGVGGGSADINKGPLVDGEFCDPQMLNCCGLMIDKVESVVLMYGDASFPTRDSPSAHNLVGTATGGGHVEARLFSGTGFFVVQVPTFPGQPIEQILDQLAQQMVNRSKTEDGFDFAPMVDDNGISVLRSPEAQLEVQSFDPGLQFIEDIWADFDKDGDVDVADFANFGQCFSGAGIPFNPASCDSYADFDNDADVDTGDFAQFVQCFGGSNQPVPPSCTLR